ncbi:hypothetical protein [Pseudomonas putida]
MDYGFRKAKRAVIDALESGDYQHVARGDIEIKNLLATGAVSAAQVAGCIRGCDGTHYSSSPHHVVAELEVHVLRRHGWYIKFYFIEPQTWFVSVHQ